MKKLIIGFLVFTLTSVFSFSDFSYYNGLTDNLEQKIILSLDRIFNDYLSKNSKYEITKQIKLLKNIKSNIEIRYGKNNSDDKILFALKYIEYLVDKHLIIVYEQYSNSLEFSGNRFGLFSAVSPTDKLISAKSLGIDKSRLVIYWEDFEPKQDKFVYDFYDLYINEHYKAGISLVVTLKSNSSWGSKSGDGKLTSSIPKNWDDYSDFLEEVVGRYKDKVKFWQIENEVYDNNKYWAGSKEDYVKILQHAHAIIKKIDPEAKIVLQGFANIMFNLIEEGDKDVIEFFNYIMSKEDYFDVVDFHQYFQYDAVYSEVKILNKAMKDNRYIKPLICTEAGGLDLRLFAKHIFNPNPGIPIIRKLLLIKNISDEVNKVKAGGVTEQEFIDFGIFLKNNSKSGPILEKYQSEDLIKRISLTLSQGVEFVYWLALMDRKEPIEFYFSHMGLLDTDGRKKPHYYSYKIMINKLKGFESVDELSFDPKILRFNFKDKKSIFIVWSDKQTTVDLTKYVSAQKVKISYIVTSLDKSNNPIYQTDNIVSSKIVTINETPIFVQE